MTGQETLIEARGLFADAKTLKSKDNEAAKTKLERAVQLFKDCLAGEAYAPPEQQKKLKNELEEAEKLLREL